MSKFKDIKGYEGLYKISKTGEVYSFYTNRLLKRNKGQNGYLSIVACKKGKKHLKTIHRLVALTYIDNPEGKPCVNHKDGNKINNNVSNLEWVTYSENNIHAIKTGLIIIKRGKDHHSYGKTPHNKGKDSRITNSCVLCGTEYKTYNHNSTFCSRACRNIKAGDRLKEFRFTGNTDQYLEDSKRQSK